MKKRRIICISNPTAGPGAGNKFGAVLRRLRDQACSVTVRETAARGDGERLARQAAKSGAFDVVVAVGGDGTINEVANGLHGSSAPLGIIPAGTANVLALELGIGTSPRRVADIIAHGEPRPIWPGVANGKLFLAMASCGFDGRVLGGVSLAVKRRVGKGAYVWSGIQTWFAGDTPTIDVAVNGKSLGGGWVIVANTRRYAGRFVLAPDADPFEPGFQLVTLPGRSRTDMARYIVALLLGRLARLRDVSVIEAKELRIEGPPGELFEIDGDEAGHLPLDIAVAMEPLMLLA
ncbi:MAG: diacylglycerol/lipid kinase family protein [Sphingomonadales bacterium]